MKEARPYILFTKLVDEVHVSELKSLGANIDTIPFINVKPISNQDTVEQVNLIAQQKNVVAFTSKNAVKAVSCLVKDNTLDWPVYCLSSTTTKLVKELLPTVKIVDTAENAAELANKIVEDNTVKRLTFFCGNKRRDELPTILRANGINVTEIVTYRTEALHHKLDKHYNAYVFYSPSAVDSFFTDNDIKKECISFAIGSTTAAELKKHTNNIIVATYPSQESINNTIKEYYNLK